VIKLNISYKNENKKSTFSLADITVLSLLKTNKNPLNILYDGSYAVLLNAPSKKHLFKIERNPCVIDGRWHNMHLK
jgi:hypothetical protein